MFFWVCIAICVYFAVVVDYACVFVRECMCTCQRMYVFLLPELNVLSIICFSTFYEEEILLQIVEIIDPSSWNPRVNNDCSSKKVKERQFI